MSKQSNLALKLGWSVVFLLLFGVSSYRQYLKFADGRGVARWLIPVDASMATQLFVFVLLPLAAALIVGWTLARDSDQ